MPEPKIDLKALDAMIKKVAEMQEEPRRVVHATPRKRGKLGRPPRVMPPKTDHSAEEIAKAMLSLRADHKFTYTAKTVYRCVGCQRVVEYPDTLYRDGRCRKCRGRS